MFRERTEIERRRLVVRGCNCHCRRCRRFLLSPGGGCPGMACKGKPGCLEDLNAGSIKKSENGFFYTREPGETKWRLVYDPKPPKGYAK